MNRAIVISLNRKNCVVKTLFSKFVERETTVLWTIFLCDLFKEKQLVTQKFFLLISQIMISFSIDDSLLEENREIVIYLRNGEWTHEL